MQSNTIWLEIALQFNEMTTLYPMGYLRMLRGKRSIDLQIGVDNMKKDNWIANTNKVNAWLAKEDRGEAGDAIAFTIGLGNKSSSEEMLTNYWTAIRNIGSDFDDFPKARVGQNDVLDTEARGNADSVHANIMNVFATIGEDELILATVLPHGRTGGVYDSMESFAKVIADKVVRDLVTAYKEDRWTGKMNGNVPVVTPRPLNAKSEGGSEEE